MAEEEQQPCIDCGCEDTTLEPCPYAEEIGGDDEPVWLCSGCRGSRADDI